MKIAVCEDEPIVADRLRDRAAAWADDRRIQAQVAVFSSAEAFLFAWEADRGFDLLLLDIQLQGQDGVSLARALRGAGARLDIVFITALPDFLAEGYEVAALHYLMKPVQPERLRRALDRAWARLCRERRALAVQTSDSLLRVYEDELIYAEAFAHTLALHTVRQTLETRMSLAALESLVEPGAFFRCHRSYLVGLRYVERVGRTELLLDGGTWLPLSRRLYGEANQAFIRYYAARRPPADA